jgi:hypothetical protein
MLDQKVSVHAGVESRLSVYFIYSSFVEGGVCVCFRETEMMWFKKQIRVHYI